VTPRTHFPQAKPPWRDGSDRTRCGRRIVGGKAAHSRTEASRASVTEPDEAMIARAAAEWRFATTSTLHSRSSMLVTWQAPPGICKPCWRSLGCHGRSTWSSDPIEVLRTDLADSGTDGRIVLAKEMVALADLWAAHQDEFRGLMESEEVLGALAKIRS
jgi:hypothetical protein